MVAFSVYALCALTSGSCFFVLAREYMRGRNRVLLWTGLCFFGLFLSNLVLIVDKLVAPDINLAIFRVIPTVIGFGVLIYGLLWEAP